MPPVRLHVVVLRVDGDILLMHCIYIYIWESEFSYRQPFALIRCSLQKNILLLSVFF